MRARARESGAEEIAEGGVALPALVPAAVEDVPGDGACLPGAEGAGGAGEFGVRLGVAAAVRLAAEPSLLAEPSEVGGHAGSLAGPAGAVNAARATLRAVPDPDRAAVLLLERAEERLVAVVWPQCGGAADPAAEAADLTGLARVVARRCVRALTGAGLLRADGTRSESCERFLRALVTTREAQALGAAARARKATP